MGRTRPSYSPEFRHEVVRLLRSGARTRHELAAGLGCSEQTLRNWRIQDEADRGERPGALSTDERAQLRELERENRVLRQEREILVMAGDGNRVHLMKTLEQVRVPSFVVGRDRMVTWLNDAAKECFGDLRGRQFTEVVTSADVSAVKRQQERKLREGVSATVYQVDVLTRDGRRHRAEISSVLIPDGDEYHAIFGVVLPVSGRVFGVVLPIRSRTPAAPLAHLTARQAQMLLMLGEGASTEQIAAALHLSKVTIRNHIQHMLDALGVHSRLEAVAFARYKGSPRDS